MYMSKLLYQRSTGYMIAYAAFSQIMQKLPYAYIIHILLKYFAIRLVCVKLM